ncbi:MAG: AAA family ATPase [Pseudomonadales bacterium]|nr:AAA family ATPase [Pseudomonadales bacterium]
MSTRTSKTTRQTRTVSSAAAANDTGNALQPPTSDRFATIGAYGFAPVQIALLAALVTEDPLLLIGRAGTGKTYLLNSISEALGLEHRHYNASLIAFDDLVGFPYPDDERQSVRFLQTPATIWGAQSVLVDEISRCKPEHQNRLFSLVHERRIQGIALESLRFRWAAMNPCSADQQDNGEYLGSEALDPALADRFAIIVEVGDWAGLSDAQQRLVANPGGEGLLANDNGALRTDIEGWRACFVADIANCPALLIEYARIVTGELGRSGLRISPRRARLLARSLLAASIIEGKVREASVHTILECSLPQRASGIVPLPAKIAAAHRIAWDASLATGIDKWLHDFHLTPTLDAKLRVLAESCPGPDAGTLAIEQFLANDRPERCAAFALALYPAALRGYLPLGAEAIGDLGRLATELLSIDGEIRWQESASQNSTTHPELAGLMRIVDALQPHNRQHRARQLFYWSLVKRIAIDQPAVLEQEFNACIEYLRARAA